eukprot:2484424-Pyramimonas_sp.AAC.1
MLLDGPICRHGPAAHCLLRLCAGFPIDFPSVDAAGPRRNRPSTPAAGLYRLTVPGRDLLLGVWRYDFVYVSYPRWNHPRVPRLGNVVCG